MNPDREPPGRLSLEDYQRESALTDLDAANNDPITPLLGLAGEVGSLIAEYSLLRLLSRWMAGPVGRS